MLTSKKRAFLRKAAHSLDPVVRIGKDGFGENLIQSILDVVASRELIKIKVLQNCETGIKEIAEKIQEKIDGEVVGVVGRTIIFFKESKERPEISLELKKIK